MGFLSDLFSGDSQDIEKFSISLFIPEDESRWTVHASGYLNSTNSTLQNVCISTSLQDITDPNKNYSISSLHPDIQESNTNAYQYILPIPGSISPNSYIPVDNSSAESVMGWDIATIPLALLDFPKSGERKIRIISRVTTQNSAYEITNTNLKKGMTILSSSKFEYHYLSERPGYLDRLENTKKVKRATIMMAVIMAMADGKLHDIEGLTIRKWMKKDLSRFINETTQKEYKEMYNSTLKDAHSKAKDNHSSYYLRTIQLINKMATDIEKTEIISLCYEVLAADGEAVEEELNVARKLSDDLRIDPNEIEKIRDRTMISLNVSDQDETNIDAILSINPDWGKQEIESHLYKLYDKWSGRLNALNDNQRVEAQSWIDKIAEAKKKHGL